MSNWQLSVPEQAPDQPAKLRPDCGTEFSVTSVPFINFTAQDFFLSGQFNPAGVLVIEPSVFLLIFILNFGSFLNTALKVILPVGLM
jgi:hypothetical protein